MVFRVLLNCFGVGYEVRLAVLTCNPRPPNGQVEKSWISQLGHFRGPHGPQHGRSDLITDPKTLQQHSNYPELPSKPF